MNISTNQEDKNRFVYLTFQSKIILKEFQDMMTMVDIKRKDLLVCAEFKDTKKWWEDYIKSLSNLEDNKNTPEFASIFLKIENIIRAHSDNIERSENLLEKLQQNKKQDEYLLYDLEYIKSEMKYRVFYISHSQQELRNDLKIFMHGNYNSFPDPETQNINWPLYRLAHLFDNKNNKSRLYQNDKIYIKNFWKLFESYKKQDDSFSNFMDSNTFLVFKKLHPEFDGVATPYERFKLFLFLNVDGAHWYNPLEESIDKYKESIENINITMDNIKMVMKSSEKIISQNSEKTETLLENIAKFTLDSILNEHNPKLFNKITKYQKHKPEFQQLLRLQKAHQLEKILATLKDEISLKIQDYEQSRGDVNLMEKYLAEMIEEKQMFVEKIKNIEASLEELSPKSTSALEEKRFVL